MVADKSEHDVVLIDSRGHPQQDVPSSLGPEQRQKTARGLSKRPLQRLKIRFCSEGDPPDLLGNRLHQLRNPVRHARSHRKEVIGDAIQQPHGVVHIPARTGHLDPSDLGMRRRQTLGQSIKREGQHLPASRQTTSARKRLKRIGIEHLIRDQRHAMATAQRDHGVAFGLMDERSGGIVGIDHDDRAYAMALGSA